MRGVSCVFPGTTLFVFISGFLFHHVFFKKYNYLEFVKNKARNVLLPYIVLGLLPVILYTLKRTTLWDGYFSPMGTDFFNTYIIPFAKYYFTGAFLNAYWYIPFAMCMFLMSPLHVAFIKLKLKTQLSFVITFFTIAIFIHRPIYNLSQLQSVIYFLPIYLIGILSSIHREKIYSLFKNREYILLALWIGLVLIQSLPGDVGSYHKEPFLMNGFDYMLIQKTVLCFFLMTWLSRFESVKNKWINTLAATSFPIFFIHPFVLWFITHFDLSFMNKNSWLLFFLFISFLILTCIFIAKSVKYFIPKYSRALVGY